MLLLLLSWSNIHPNEQRELINRIGRVEHIVFSFINGKPFLCICKLRKWWVYAKKNLKRNIWFWRYFLKRVKLTIMLDGVGLEVQMKLHIRAQYFPALKQFYHLETGSRQCWPYKVILKLNTLTYFNMVVGCFETMCCISKFTPIEFAEPDMFK